MRRADRVRLGALQMAKALHCEAAKVRIPSFAFHVMYSNPLHLITR